MRYRRGTLERVWLEVLVLAVGIALAFVVAGLVRA